MIREHTTALAILREEVREYDGGIYELALTIELKNEFAVQVSFMEGKLTCGLWDERNSRQLGESDMSLEEFKEWALIAIGKEPRSTYGNHYRATHPETELPAPKSADVVPFKPKGLTTFEPPSDPPGAA